MELDKSELQFNSEGGEQTVTVLNYQRWWISGGYEDSEYVDGKMLYRNYVYPESTDGGAYDILDGGWYQVTVPDKGRSNEAVIRVEQNTVASPRKATIKMQAGNAFTSIMIYQP